MSLVPLKFANFVFSAQGVAKKNRGLKYAQQLLTYTPKSYLYKNIVFSASDAKLYTRI